MKIFTETNRFILREIVPEDVDFFLNSTLTRKCINIWETNLFRTNNK